MLREFSLFFALALPQLFSLRQGPQREVMPTRSSCGLLRVVLGFLACGPSWLVRCLGLAWLCFLMSRSLPLIPAFGIRFAALRGQRHPWRAVWDPALRGTGCSLGCPTLWDTRLGGWDPALRGTIQPFPGRLLPSGAARDVAPAAPVFRQVPWQGPALP